MFHNTRKNIFRSIGLVIFITILFFVYTRYTKYRTGPQIVSLNIHDFMTVSSPSLLVNAELKNIQSVVINGRNITLQDKIYFHEILVFSPGTNIIEIVLTDAFGKEKHYIYNIFYRAKDTNHLKTLTEARLQNKELPVDTLIKANTH